MAYVYGCNPNRFAVLLYMRDPFRSFRSLSEMSLAQLFNNGERNVSGTNYSDHL
jgi:hypothetical protein